MIQPEAQAPAPCPDCQRPIDDPQTCQDCGKVTCTDCAAYSEDGEGVWCDPCASTELRTQLSLVLNKVKEFVLAAKDLDESEARIRRGELGSSSEFRDTLVRHYTANDAVEALDLDMLTMLIESVEARQ